MEQRTYAVAVYLYCCPCPCTWIQKWRRQMPGGLSLSSTAPCTSQPPALPCERGVLGSFWLLGSSQPWSFRLQIAKAQLHHWSQTSGAACYSTLRGAKPCCHASWHPVPVIRFQFLKSALAPLLAVGTDPAAGLQATSGQAATSSLCCLLLLAPPAYSLHMAMGDLSASPCSSLVCFNHLPGCFSVFCRKDEFVLCR